MWWALLSLMVCVVIPWLRRMLKNRVYAVQLRDARTGKPLGMTKQQWRRYVYALGTSNSNTVAKAYREIQERRQRLQK